MKSYCNSDSFMFLQSTPGSPRAMFLGMGMWGRIRGSGNGREPGEGCWGVACYILFTVSQCCPIEGGSCVLLSLLKSLGGGECWGVQLANGLRLMKWIMRGARTGFCAKKRRWGRDCCTLTCSGLNSQGPIYYLPRGQRPEDSKAGPAPPSQVAFVGIVIMILIIINTYWEYMGQVLCQATLMLYLLNVQNNTMKLVLSLPIL